MNYVDTAGTDAIWIHETDSASYLGHSGLLVEDEETGKWYFFYWGPVNENENPLILATSGSPCNCVVIEVEIGDEDLYSVEGLNKILGNSTDEFVKSRSGLITDIHYFEGDFSQTLSYLKTLANEENLEYHLLRDNCVQNTWEALGKSDIRFASTSCPVIPDFAYAKMLILDFQFTKCAHFLSLEDFSAVCL